MDDFDPYKIIPELESIVRHHNTMSKCFYWKSPRNYDNKKTYEKEHSKTYKFIYNGDEIFIEQKVSCSSYISYKLYITINNQFTGYNIKFIKDIINKYPSIDISNSKWKWNYEYNKLICHVSNTINDCKHHFDLKLFVKHNTTIINPGYNCSLLRTDIKNSNIIKLFSGLTYITNSKGVSGFKNQEEIDSFIFENIL